MTGHRVRKANLVVVDDDPSIVRMLGHILNARFSGELHIHCFTNSRDARDWISRTRCDILLSDIEMPGIDGLEMLRFALSCNAWTRAICMTAHSTWDRIAAAIENGACDYLSKPIEQEILLEVVGQECARLARWQKALREACRAATC